MSKNIHTDQLNFTEQKISNNLEITRAIDVQLIDTNLYMSKELNQPMGSRGVYGGQVKSIILIVLIFFFKIVAQALKSAWDTVPDEFFIHVYKKFLFFFFVDDFFSLYMLILFWHVVLKHQSYIIFNVFEMEGHLLLGL